MTNKGTVEAKAEGRPRKSADATKQRRSPFSRRGEQAIQANQEAAQADAMPRSEVGDDTVYGAEARLARARAELYLKPVDPVAVCAAEAVTWENKANEIYLAKTGQRDRLACEDTQSSSRLRTD